MSKAQEKFGEPLELVRKKIFPVMNSMVQDFIRQSPFAVLATSNRGGDCDASPKGGRPGFVKVLDEKHLLVPDIKGNKLFQSYENVESNAKAGLVFLIPGCDWTCRVNGRVKVVSKDDWPLNGVETEVFAEDEMTSLLQGLSTDVLTLSVNLPGPHPLLRKYVRRLAKRLP